MKVGIGLVVSVVLLFLGTLLLAWLKPVPVGYLVQMHLGKGLQK